MFRLINIIGNKIGLINLFKGIFLGLISGLLNFSFINLITIIIGFTEDGSQNAVIKEFILVFILVIILNIWVRRSLSSMIIHLSQNQLWTLRKEFINIILKANYIKFTKNKDKIYPVILGDVNTLTNSAVNLISFVTALIVGLSSLFYLLFISFHLFFVTLIFTTIGVSVYLIGLKMNKIKFEKARKVENSFIDNLNSILRGFKEIYMEPKKGTHIRENKIEPISNEAYMLNTDAYQGLINNQIFTQILFYTLIALILLFFSVQFQIDKNSTIKFIFILMYFVGSVEQIVALIPEFTRAIIAFKQIYTVKNELESVESEIKQDIQENEFVQVFQNLKINNLSFLFEEVDKKFKLGPINFDFQREEIIFIYGENGSGKTTILNCIVGMYTNYDGQILYNGIEVNKLNSQDYRANFSIVFSDFFLFNEIILKDIFSLDKWNYYIRLFELNEKITINDFSFSTLDLSTGERKRLALIIMLMEKKSILVLDEWAADQDPRFKKKFYLELLPILKKEGYTIIAITHDDNYYKCADKLYRVDKGKMYLESKIK